MGGVGCLMCGTVAGDAVVLGAAEPRMDVRLQEAFEGLQTQLQGIAVAVAQPPPWRG